MSGYGRVPDPPGGVPPHGGPPRGSPSSYGYVPARPGAGSGTRPDGPVAMVPAVVPAAPEAPAPADPQVRLEWWERLRDRAARSRWLTALLRVRACITWVSLVVLGVTLAISPVTRTILGAWIGCLWVMVCWFWMARAKTVSWAHVSGVFALSMPWAGAVARLSFHLTAAAGAVVSDAAAQIVVAPVVEELGKLAPLCVLALIAPGRTRRLLVQDWLVLGVAAGAGFMAVEETTRRLAYISGDAPGLLLQLRPESGNPLSGPAPDQAQHLGGRPGRLGAREELRGGPGSGLRGAGHRSPDRALLLRQRQRVRRLLRVRPHRRQG